MKTITAPDRSGELLRAGQVMTVTGNALVEWIGEGGVRQGPVNIATSTPFGPFDRDVQLVISAVAGDVMFGLANNPANILISATAPAIIIATGNAQENVLNLQRSIAENRITKIYGDKKTGQFLINDTIIIPSHRKLIIADGTELKGDNGIDHRLMIRTSNVGATGTRPANWNWMPLFHSAVDDITIGTVRLIKTGGSWALSYKLATDVSYGDTVTITANKKVKLVAPGGAWIAARVGVISGLADGTYIQNIKAIPSNVTPKSVSLTRAVGQTKAITGNFTSGSPSVTLLNQAIPAGLSFSASGYIPANTPVAYAEDNDNRTCILAANATASGSTIAITCTIYNEVTVTEVNHGRRVGSLVMIVDPASDNFSGLFRVATVIDADTYTYRDHGSFIGTSTTAVAYASENIAIVGEGGARIESASSASNNYVESFVSHLTLVNGLTVLGGIWKNLTGKYCANIQGVTLGLFDGQFFDNTVSDGFTSQGSFYDSVIQNTAGSSLSDNIHGCGVAVANTTAIQSSEDLGFNSIDNIEFNNIRFTDQDVEPIRLFGSINSTISNIRVNSINGTLSTKAALVGMIVDSLTPNLIGSTHGNIDNVVINNAAAKVNPGWFYYIASCQAGSINTFFIRSLELNNCKSEWEHQSVSHGFLTGQLNIGKTNFGKAVLNNSIVNIFRSQNNTCVIIADCKSIHLTVNDGQFINLSDIVRWGTADVTSAVIIINGARVSKIGRIINTIAGNVRYIALNNCSGNVEVALGAVKGGTESVPLRIKCKGNSLTGVLPNTFTVAAAGGYISADGIEIDGATVTAPEKGDIFYNTNAAYGAGVGLYAMGATTTTRIAA